MRKDHVIAQGQQVLDVELQGLKALRDSLGDAFYHACNAIFKDSKKVIVTGMGKSGHVGKKIAATLASTGTPAFFVHPAEATHGDLGMIGKEDIILMLSNSGNTVELQAIINYAQRFSIPIIGITKYADSMLGTVSTHLLLLPNVHEACVLGVAPTTSTTNTLALGDAIAITLLAMRGFTHEDFNIFHPGGSLGKQLLSVNKIMHKANEIPLVAQHTSMQEAILIITSHHFGCVGVVNALQEMIGIITDGDLRRYINKDLLHKSVDEIMNINFLSINQDTNVAKALSIMEANKITMLFITENKKPIGIVHLHDLLRLGVA